MIEWILGVLQASGYAGIVLLTFLENVFPPIPSELILPLAGFLCAQGHLNLYGAIAAGSLGSLAGATLWYYVGLYLGQGRLVRLAARHGRWLTVEPEDLEKANAWFRRWGDPAIFVGRFMPGARTLISVPAGIARVPMPHFLVFSLAGTAIWTGALTVGGYFLEEHYARIENWLNPFANATLGLMVAWYAYRVATFKPRGRSARSERMGPPGRWHRERSLPSRRDRAV